MLIPKFSAVFFQFTLIMVDIFSVNPYAFKPLGYIEARTRLCSKLIMPGNLDMRMT